MKEGYLQLKIAELNDKCQHIEQALSLEKANLEHIQEKVGGYKEVIKRFLILNSSNRKHCRIYKRKTTQRSPDR